MSSHPRIHLNKGATIKYQGRGLEFLPGHFIYFTREMEIFISFFFFFFFFFKSLKSQKFLIFISLHLGIGCISTMPCGHLFISPIFPHKIFISKKLQPPPPQISNGGSLMILVRTLGLSCTVVLFFTITFYLQFFKIDEALNAFGITRFDYMCL